MRTVYLSLWLLLTAIFTLLQYFTVCNKSGVVGASSKPNHFTLQGEGLNVDCEYNAFTKSNFSLINSLNSDSDCYNKVAGYLKNNPNKALIVDGYYSESEVNKSIYDNLGLARASQIKRGLINTFGIPASQIKTGYRLVEDSAFVTDTLKNGYRLRLDKLRGADLSGFDASREITLNFNTGSSDPILTPEIRSDFAQFINYIEANPGSTLQVTGHTDTQGEADQNLILGQNRANEIKEYLNRNGIPMSTINTTSKGEDQPISDIDAENRRVTINIQSNNQ